jgi:hypothetical protein
MSRSGLPGTLFIELARPGDTIGAVLGTDAIYYVDGRYGRERVLNEIYERYSDYFKHGFTLLGYTRPGDYTGKIHKL